MATSSHNRAANPVHTLPTEICERIIDFVAEEVQYAARISMWEDEVFNTLQACALTCRAWTPRSQLHLFRFLGVDCSYKTKRPLSDFYEFMNRHKPLQAYVEALLARADDYKMSAMHVLPIRMPRLLPQLAHLQFIKGVLYLPSGPFFQVSMRQFTMVRELVLYKIAFYSVQDLRRVAGAMQNLRSLSVTCVSWHHPSTKPPPTSYLPTRVRLTTLRVDSEAEWAQDPRSVYFVEWLARSGMSTSLVALYLGCLMIQDCAMFSAVEAVLRGCYQTIQEVGLSWSPNLDVDISSLSGALAHCPRLQELELYLPYLASIFKQLSTLISNIITTKCSILRLNFEQYPRRALKSLEPAAYDWRILDNILHRPRWKTLTEVGVDRNMLIVNDDTTFVWGDTYHWEPCEKDGLEKWCAELRRCLPLVYKQGKVRFDSNKDAHWVPLL